MVNWRDIGGPDAEINLYVTVNDESFSTALNSSLLRLPALGIASRAIQKKRLSEVSDATANDPFGIGLTSFSNIRNTHALSLLGTCGIYNLPTVFGLKSGEYPLVYPLTLFKAKARLPVAAREFLEFAETEQAQKVIASFGYVDMGISRLPVNRQGIRLANSFMRGGTEVPFSDIQEMMGLINGAERLSTTFRFKPGSKALDSASLKNAERLVEGLILGNYADKVVHLVGFTDSAGGSAQNKVLAKQRAQNVQKAIMAAAPDGSLNAVDFQISGFGEASPLACEDKEAGKQINRRVEIWIKDRS